MQGTHILMRLLAKDEASWLWNKAPKFRNLQQNFNIKLVMLLIALVSTIYVPSRWKRSLYMPCFTNISTLKFYQDEVFLIDPPSERGARDHFMVTV